MAIAVFSFFLSVWLKTYNDTGNFNVPFYIRNYYWLTYIVVILWPLLLNINGLYPTNRLRTLWEKIRIILFSSFQGFLIIFTVLFIFKLQIVSRFIVGGFIVIESLLLIIKESFVTYSLRNLRKKGTGLRNILIIGTADSIRPVVKQLKENISLGLNLVGVLLPKQEIQEKKFEDAKIIGSLSDIEEVLHKYPIDNILITTYIGSYYEDMAHIIGHCEEEGKEIWLPAKLFNTKISKPDADEFLEIPIFVFRAGPKFSWQILIKMILDRIFAFILCVLSLPIIFISAILIKLTSSGPVIFKQKRLTLHGRIFTLYKLRTMYSNAEELKDELSKMNIVKGPAFKLAEDPRITPVGKVLRKLSIDEIPQFWNVLKGDMSLVGPRPPLPEEVAMYKGWQRRRISMRPGITGLVQVSGRSLITNFDKWAELDLKYIDNWSLWLDFKIMLKTAFIVLNTKGAK
ncbi:MAG: sugar transferase [Candidatus Omnitrophota bacterium]